MRRLVLAVCLVVCASLLYAARQHLHPVEPEDQYGVMLDAGSSGTKMHVFRWLRRDREVALHQVNQPVTKRPGLQDFAEDTVKAQSVVSDLLSAAAKIVPSSQQRHTRVFIKGTAGMRLLPASKREGLLDACRAAARASVFWFDDKDAEVISGELESVYGWLTVNYLRGTFDRRRSLAPIGALDIGGDSVQIAYVPLSAPFNGQSDQLAVPTITAYAPRDVRAGGASYGLYVHSYLGFGLDAARRMQRAALTLVEAGDQADSSLAEHLERHPPQDEHHVESVDSKILTDPCSNPGQADSFIYRGVQFHSVGIGDATACQELTDVLMLKAKCHRDEGVQLCGLSGVHQPALPSTISAFSGAYYVTNFYGLGEHPTVAQIRDAATKFCATPATEITKNIAEKQWFGKFCFYGCYVASVLSAVGFDRDGRVVEVTDDHGSSLDYVLGAMLNEVEDLRTTRHPMPSIDDSFFSTLTRFTLVVLLAFTCVLCTKSASTLRGNRRRSLYNEVPG